MSGPRFAPPLRPSAVGTRARATTTYIGAPALTTKPQAHAPATTARQSGIPAYLRPPPRNERAPATQGTTPAARRQAGEGAAAGIAQAERSPAAGAPEVRSAERVASGGAKPAKAGAHKRERFEEVKSEAPLPDIEPVPDPAAGPVSIPRTPLFVRLPTAAFDAPATLDIEPERRSDAKLEPPTPEVLSYRAVFADAIAAARRLHDALLVNGARVAAEAAAAEEARADKRQSAFDSDLDTLDRGLADARARLAFSTETALTLLDARAETARLRIGQAALHANARLAAAKAKLESDLVKPRGERAEISMTAFFGMLRVRMDGALAEAALTRLGTQSEKEFPAVADPMTSAVNEAIATRLPNRTQRRGAYFQQEAKAELELLEQSFSSLPTAFANAFSGVDGMISNVGTAGPAAVGRAKAAALQTLDRAVSQMRRTIQAGQASAEAALVRQHEFGRAQLAEAAASRARSEANAAEKRAERNVETTEALAEGQGKAVRAVIANVALERRRPAAAFARAAIGAASRLKNCVADLTAEQIPRQTRMAADERQGLDRQSFATSVQMAASTEAMAERLATAAVQSGERIGQQADSAAAEFVKFPEPVARSIVAYLPPVGEAYKKVFDLLEVAIGDTRKQVDNALSGKGGEGAGSNDKSGKPAPRPPPDMAPNQFFEVAERVIADAKAEEKVASLIARSSKEVPNTTSKSHTIYNALSAFSTNVETVMSALRGITGRQGAAIKAFYHDELSHDIEFHIRIELPKTFSAGSTNRKNVAAALNYLQGNNVEAALLEMQAAVNYWNDEARVEAVQRSLTPAQMKQLEELDQKTGGAVTAVRNDLGGVDRDVFDALQKQDVGKANALRLRAGIDSDRGKRGDAGADATVDRLVAASERAADDPIAGADPLGLDEQDERDARQKQRWEETQQAFAQLEPLPAGEQAAFEGPGAALYRYATATRNYQVFVPDKFVRSAPTERGSAITRR